MDELDPDTARELDAFARDGDGIATLLGPTVLLSDSGSGTCSSTPPTTGP